MQFTSGSRQLLPDVFPGVEHISYFSLRTDTATALLLDTSHHLGAVAIPYALAVQEDFVTRTLDRFGPAWGCAGLVGLSVAAAAVVSIAATAAVPPDNSPPLLLRWAGVYALAGGGGVIGCFTAIMLGASRVGLIVAGYAAVGLLFAVIARRTWW